MKCEVATGIFCWVGMSQSCSHRYLEVAAYPESAARGRLGTKNAAAEGEPWRASSESPSPGQLGRPSRGMSSAYRWAAASVAGGRRVNRDRDDASIRPSGVSIDKNA